MAKIVRKKAKKVLKPAQSTDVKIFAKSLFVKRTHDQSSRPTTTGEMIVKANHYSIKTQEKALFKIGALLKSNERSLSRDAIVNIVRTTSYKLFSDAKDVRSCAQKILLHIMKMNLIDTTVLHEIIYPALKAAMTHVEQGVRVDTLPFLSSFITTCISGHSSSSNEFSSSKNNLVDEILSLLLVLINIVSEELLQQPRAFDCALLGIGKVFDALLSYPLFQWKLKSPSSKVIYALLELIRFLTSSTTLETFLKAIDDSSGDKSSQIDTQQVHIVRENEAFHSCIKCLGHSLSSLLLIRNSRPKSKKFDMELNSIAKASWNALRQLFDASTEPSLKVNIAILIDLVANRFAEEHLEDFSFSSEKVLAWLLERFCTEKSAQTSRKLALLIWQSSSRTQQNDGFTSLYLEVFPDRTLTPDQRMYPQDFMRQAIRQSANSGQFEFFSNGILDLLRQRVEYVTAKNDCYEVKSSSKRNLHVWEFELCADLPFVLWKLVKKYSALPHSPMNQTDYEVLVNTTTILWDVMRTYGGEFSTHRQCARHITTISRGIDLLRRPKFLFREKETLNLFLERIGFYCHSVRE